MSNAVGYARVSTREQNTGTQEAALRAAGAGRVFADQGESSRRKDRPQWLVVPHVNVLAKWDARASRNLLTKLDP